MKEIKGNISKPFSRSFSNIELSNSSINFAVTHTLTSLSMSNEID